MQWFILGYIAANLISALICAAIAILAPQRGLKSVWDFRLFMLITGFWCLTSGLFFMNTTLHDFWIWTGLQTIAYVATPVMWFLFILKYIGDRCTYPWLLFLVPCATLVVYWHPDWSTQMWTISNLNWQWGVPTVDFERGFWFKRVFIPYNYSLIFLGHGFLLRAMVHNQRQRRPLALLLCCGLIPLGLNTLTLSPALTPIRFFDLTPIGLSISSVLFSWMLSHYQLLQRSPLAYHQIFSSLQAAILVLDCDDRLVEFNPAAVRMFSCTNHSLGQGVRQCIGFLDEVSLQQLSVGEQVEVYDRNCYFQVEQYPIYRQNRSLGYILSIVDVTRSRQLQNQVLQGVLLYDALTGLPNRTLFIDRLNHAIKRYDRTPTTSFAVLFFDLDRFKVTNDSLGHNAGDRLLIEIATRLQSHLRSEDTFARFGGDEFAILVEQSHPQDIELLCHRLQRQIEAPMLLGDRKISTSASIGIAFGMKGASSDQLLRNADVAMYQAKASGRGTFAIYDQKLHKKVLKNTQIEVALGHALENQELFVLFQPIIQMDCGILCGFEALLRWHHDEYGLIPPDTFIPIAEDMGIISTLDGWVLQQSCHQLQQWNAQFPGHPLTISVNLSLANFMLDNLADTVAEVLESMHLSGSQLKLEITESIVMKNPDFTAKTLKAFQALGVGIVLDDFGTGYSSLSYLHQLPLDALKIDRSFIHQADANAQSAEIIKTILTLAQSLKLNVIAEGIETPFQQDLLMQLGCPFGQGFLWWRPLTASDASDAIARQHKDGGLSSAILSPRQKSHNMKEI